jgi:hypothetical protein
MKCFDSISIGNLGYIKVNNDNLVIKDKRPMLWASCDPSDNVGSPIEIGSIFLVLEESFPYILVLTSEGLGWIYFEDAEIVQ